MNREMNNLEQSVFQNFTNWNCASIMHKIEKEIYKGHKYVLIMLELYLHSNWPPFFSHEKIFNEYIHIS